ncbi:MAG: hypothetical protein AB8F94_12125 [Saprospiraceae bacterium]
MNGKSKAPASKASKNTIARKNAEAQKAKKKAVRIAKGNVAPPAAYGKKGKSAIPQGKKRK